MNLTNITLATALFFLSACATSSPVTTPLAEVKKPNQFQSVWNQLTSDPVKKLPQLKVSYRKLAAHGKNIILSDAKRTLSNHADILPQFEKLAHPNGICFKGTWSITAHNKYSGYFKQGAKGLIIVRASSAMSNTKSGELRSFGFAGKVFPTMNPTQVNAENTANFFLIDDLGGTRARHYTDVSLSNSPPASITSVVLKSFLYAAKLARAFSQADENPKVRQLYEISELGEKNLDNIVTPQWMKVNAHQGQTVNESDFRDELTLKSKPLVFSISVASDRINGKKDWQNIGQITLDTSVVSNSCDHRLHFHHAKWRTDLKH